MAQITNDVPYREKDRKETRLENDSGEHCKECGIELPIAPVGAGYERCPECVLEDTKDELLTLFGSLNSVEAAPARDTKSHLVVTTEYVLGGFVKVFDDDRAEFVPTHTGSHYWDYVTANDSDSEEQ